MRATIEAEALAAALKHSAAPSKTTLSVLQFAHLRAIDGQLAISTTDTEVFATNRIDASVAEEGEVLLHAETLGRIASGAGQITLAGDGQVTRGRSRFKVGVHPTPDDLPTPEHMQWTAMELPATQLAAGIDAVSYAADATDVRAYCQTVNVVPGAIWATDGKVAARKALDYAGQRFFIPVYQSRRLLAALAQPEASVHIGRVPNLDRVAGLRVDSPAMTLTVRTYEIGRPPEIDRVIPDPTAADARITLDRKGTVDALRRFLPFATWADGKYTGHIVAFDLRQDEVVMTDRRAENIEHLTDECVVLEQHGQIRVGLHPRQLMAALGAIHTDQVVLHFNHALSSPAVLLPQDTPIDQVAHVLMPFVL